MTNIRKIQITQGVFWVEVSSAGLNILCGCPGDTVKHLMKRGLIYPTEKDEVIFETGPNVILLSDVLLQNGNISNMAEFPILQMLYRQGMILPNHPNNTGLKPLIIGLKDQVEAQLQYIYRGNYGLATREEILATGIGSEQADEMMHLKLSFAFGKIHKSEDFLDTLIIADKPVEIRNGVTVQRLQMNVFEFQYMGESVTVDLNLPEYGNYESPYPTVYHSVKREYFSVIHCGEGDGWDINRPSMSSLLMFHGKIYLIDAGPHIINSLTSLGIGINEIEGIFHTHCHDDHFAGLTSLLRADRRIKYFATPLVRASVSKKLAALFSISEESFSDYFEVNNLAFDIWNNIEGLEVKPFFSPHPVETSIFIFRSLWEDGYRTYAHFGDIVSLDVLKKMTRSDNGQQGVSQAFFDRTKDNYLIPANVKKLDIGGGLIHGMAEDFRDDSSQKIILSHTSLALTERQKEIGSGAPFGTVERLIPSYKNYVWQFAHKYLSASYPGTPDHQLQILLNNEVIEFNPQSIILKSGALCDSMFLILTGNVEAIESMKKVKLLYAGTLVGEMPGMYQIPSDVTYRAAGFVQALRIPCNLYVKFVKSNNLYDEIEHLQSVREALGNSWLFGEGLSYPAQNIIAKSAKRIYFPANKSLETLNSQSIYLVYKGEIHRHIKNAVLEQIKDNDFFGEETALFNTPHFFNLKTVLITEMYEISGKMVANIPIVRWKLFEAYEKRKQMALQGNINNLSTFEWKDWYNIGIPNMDLQHKTLFQKILILIKTTNNNNLPEILKAIDDVVTYTKFHFSSEEELLKKHSYPEHSKHQELHKDLLNQIHKLKSTMANDGNLVGIDLIGFFRAWIIDHIFQHDTQYSHFLKGGNQYFNIG